MDSIDPATGMTWARIPQGCDIDAEVAIQAADQAFRFGTWAELTNADRADLLDRIADRLERRWENLVEPEIRDNGKRIVEVRGQFSGLHRWYRHFASEIRELASLPHRNSVPGVTSETQYMPYGVVVAITPWNSPLMILAWKLAPALAAGNTVVIKPSELASASTLEFAGLVSNAGLPKGVLNVVAGIGHEVGEALVRHRLTRKVTFTGSDSGGRKVSGAAAANIVPTTMELGGKSPQIVFQDADQDNAVNGLLSGIFLSNGQTCIAGSRLIVHSGVKEILIRKIAERTNSLKAGNPMDTATEIAPLANKAQLEKVQSMIARAIGQGAICVCGGETLSPGDCPDGYFFAPTILDGVTPDMEIWREEVFGPVLSVAAFDTENQAIEMANDSDYGLAAGIWTRDVDRAQSVARRINAGTVYINHYRSVAPEAPVGGVKRSGHGRELGADALKDYLVARSVWTGLEPVPDPFP